MCKRACMCVCTNAAMRRNTLVVRNALKGTNALTHTETLSRTCQELRTYWAATCAKCRGSGGVFSKKGIEGFLGEVEVFMCPNTWAGDKQTKSRQINHKKRRRNTSFSMKNTKKCLFFGWFCAQSPVVWGAHSKKYMRAIS